MICRQFHFHPSLCFVSLSQVPNIDFEGLFGNMQMVIKVSKQLLSDLEVSDAVGMSSGHCFRSSSLSLFFLTSREGAGAEGLAGGEYLCWENAVSVTWFRALPLLLSTAYFEAIEDVSNRRNFR